MRGAETSVTQICWSKTTDTDTAMNDKIIIRNSSNVISNIMGIWFPWQQKGDV